MTEKETSESGETANDPYSLGIRRISKRFGTTRALKDVNFGVKAGTIHGLVGGNGSGKSTLIKILAGIHSAEPGGVISTEARVVDATEMTPELARLCGMRFVHQNPAVFREMSVAENIALGIGYSTACGAIRWKQVMRSTRDLLDRFNIRAQPDDTLGDLRLADQTMVAIARALYDAERASILILDEPTAALPTSEVSLLLTALRSYADDGQTILFVSHRIDEVLDVTDEVTVLRDGDLICSTPTRELNSKDLTERIVGRPLDSVFVRPQHQPRPKVMLRVSRISVGPLREVSFEVHEGEIVGIGGLLGSGRTRLLRSLFGIYRLDGGEIQIEDNPVTIRNPASAMKLGIGYVPEDRDLDAAFPDLSVRENLSSAQLDRYWHIARFRHDLERADSALSLNKFTIRAASDRAKMSSLSGGNQQKVVVARWLRRNPKLLLLDEPTQGVDVGARADLYAAVREATATGMCVILVTSDLEELAQISDRVLVLRGGCIASEIPRGEVSRGEITRRLYLSESSMA